MSIIHDALKKAQEKTQTGTSQSFEGSGAGGRGRKTSAVLVGAAVMVGIAAVGIMGYRAASLIKNRDRGKAASVVSVPVPQKTGGNGVAKPVERAPAAAAPPVREDVLSRQGERYYWLGDLQEAEKHFRRALDTESGDRAELSNNLGLVLRKKGDLKEALSLFDAALYYNPHLVEALNNRAVVFRKMKRYADAKADLERALELAPDYGHAQFNLATVYEALGQTREALLYYRKYVANRSRTTGLDEALVLQRISVLEADVSRVSLSSGMQKQER